MGEVDVVRCGKPTARGRQCRNPAASCRQHARAEASAWSADSDVPVTPPEAMRLLMNVSWIRWQFYAELLRRQVSEAAEKKRARGNGVSAESGGLIGHHLAASPVTGGVYPTGEEIRALTRLEAEERDRCARLVKLAHDMGVTDMGDWAP